MPLQLLPNLLSPDLDYRLFLPASIEGVVAHLQGLIAESDKGGRQFLRHFKKHIPIQLLNEHTSDIDFLLEPVLKGENWGVVSDAGLPCLADPGAKLVKRAHEKQIPVFAYSGPSSITHALMLSGLPGQQFTFHGYIAKNPELRSKELKLWNRDKQTTHIFIEAPYRNLHTYQACLDELDEKTVFCLGWDLTMPSQGIFTAPISFWRRQKPPPIHKLPAIFLFR